MESVVKEGYRDETTHCTLEDKKVITNGDISDNAIDSDDGGHVKSKTNLSSKNVAELNGVTIRAQSDPNLEQKESSLTLGQSSFDPSPTDMSVGEEKALLQSSSQAGPVDSSGIASNLTYVGYESERQMQSIMALITKDLSEPYSIYTYRYFIHNWPKLCFLAMDGERCVGAVVCKLDMHKNMIRRGYIAMLAVEKEYRRNKIGSNLVVQAIKAMIKDSCDEVVLETEVTNTAALRLYENLGFVRDKRLFRYYLNGVDALRLKLWLR